VLIAHSSDFISEVLCSNFTISSLPGGREICLHMSVLNVLYIAMSYLWWKLESCLMNW